MVLPKIYGMKLYKGDLIDRLKSIPIPDKKAILLFDAFDAARDEQTRKRFLNLIQRAIHKLSDSWNIIVTVRTYDATKSRELLDLFGNPDDTEYQSEGILCRHFTIPPFNEDEILQALNQILDVWNPYTTRVLTTLRNSLLNLSIFGS